MFIARVLCAAPKIGDFLNTNYDVIIKLTQIIKSQTSTSTHKLKVNEANLTSRVETVLLFPNQIALAHSIAITN